MKLPINFLLEGVLWPFSIAWQTPASNMFTQLRAPWHQLLLELSRRNWRRDITILCFHGINVSREHWDFFSFLRNGYWHTLCAYTCCLHMTI